jgi:hypothetical protein
MCSLAPLAPLAMLALAACSTASINATEFRNDQTGQIEQGCGPMQGFAGPVQEAQQGCADSFKDQGWTQIQG